ncbi:hypothetical protein [Methyloceanibacter caenitepidi]|uniref:3-keto-disaccharide hydrolase domain-containing protein n=1 Tax=Methyloceanibacter caenitepidi TaxID=1384459 RepID=A0A0A8K7G0_9HYPH|nr:hypothetical protein [Methyloceanibacter caenitepidi]BAQ18751.1 hypothetical protein GL4_3327 [Methyloceanibacter caenitepidi]
MSSSITRFAGLLVALTVLVAGHGAFAACDPENALYEDDFEFLDVSWGAADNSILVSDGALEIRGSGGVVNLETKTKAAAVCVDVSIEEASNVSDSPAGVVFWWQDWQNYYAVFVWADGWIEVRRMEDGESKTLFTQETKALNTGTGAVNNIELALQPKDATLFVNGTEVRRFKAKRPKDGGAVGLYGISPDDAPGTFTFDNLIVNER